MRVPFTYNVRNLFVRRWTSLFTAGGIALVVAAGALMTSPAVTIGPDATIPALLATTTAQFGSRTLLVAGAQRLTYDEADARSRVLAKGLLADGVGKGDHVGILMANSVDWVVTWFAVGRIGAVGVPLNTFSQAGELAWLIRHAASSGAYTSPATWASIWRTPPRKPSCA